MAKRIHNHFFLLPALLLFACSPKKVLIDPVTVRSHPDQNVFRGSYTKQTDIINTKLDLSFNWDSAFVIGKAYIEAKPYFYSLNSITLDAKGFKINEVALVKKDERQPLKYVYDGKRLNITLDKVYQKGQKYTVFIDYIAKPYELEVGTDIDAEDYRGIYFINRDGKETGKPKQIWTQGETEYNSHWFPTISGPQEKMTQEISLTVPKNQVTLSNGILDFSSDNGDGTRTDTWRQEQPHSTYLTMIAIGDFHVVKDKWRDKEVSYYMEPKFAKNARLIFGKTPEMIEFFSKKLGIEFPWEKYSQIVVRDYSGGAMENTTAVTFFEGMNMTEDRYLDESHEDLIAHELFHQWFGNLVTAESWSNLTLNEGFATYGEYLWNEHKYGKDFADYALFKERELYLTDEHNKELNLIRYNYSNKEQMFDRVSYQKGGLVIHMLRNTVGDEAFFAALKIYLTRFAYKNVEVHDLRMVFEEVSGQDLNWFFNQWYLAAGHPLLDIQTGYDNTLKQINVTIKQNQDLNKYPLYSLPIAVDIYTSDKIERKKVALTRQNQTFTFEAQQEPDLINVDGEKYLLAEKAETKSPNQYAYQYNHAPLFIDRFEAIEKLIQFKEDKIVRETIIKALDDKNWSLRKKAVDFVVNLTADEKSEVYNKIKSMAITDERSYVRAAALKALTKAYPDKDNKPVFRQAANDKAASVHAVISGINKT